MDIVSIEVEADESGFELVIRQSIGSEGVIVRHVYRLEDPEAFYDHVKASIGPWLQEMYAAKAEYDRAKRAGDTRLLSEEEYSAYLDDAYGDDFSKRVGMEQMRERGYA